MIGSIESSTERIVAVRLTKDGRERRERLENKKKCFGCEIEFTANMAVRRMLCPACYEAALRAVRAGKITWLDLIKQGKAGEKQKPGRKPTNTFSQEMSEL